MKTFYYAILLTAAAITTFVMVRSGDGDLSVGMLLFIVWAVSPYAFLAVAAALLRKFASPPHLSIVTSVVAVIMLAATIYVYVGALDGSSSTEALVFVFVPLYLLIGGFLSLMIGLGISWLAPRTQT